MCWLLDERGYVLYARDVLCASTSGTCVGRSLSVVRPRVASILVSSGVFKAYAVNGSASVFHSVYRERSVRTKTVSIAALNDGTGPSSKQQLEVNVFAVTGTSATVAVLSGADMQVRKAALLLRPRALAAIFIFFAALDGCRAARVSR